LVTTEDMKKKSDEPNSFRSIKDVVNRIKKYQEEIKDKTDNDPIHQLNNLYYCYEELQMYFSYAKRKFTTDDDIRGITSIKKQCKYPTINTKEYSTDEDDDSDSM
jgi:hypothetical protein